MKTILPGLLLFLFFNIAVYSQTEDVQVGASLLQRYQSQGAYYDYADPEGLNIKVSVWGYVRYPGRYIIPANSNVNDLLSYAGGPSNDTQLENMSLIRTNKDSSQSLIELKYTDFLFDERMRVINKPPQLEAGDVLIAPGEPRLYFKDYLSITLSVVSTLISLSILILNIAK
ncbi:MAG: SLBB domain-containing protein [Ignavibacteriaceae bacterium]